MKEKLKILGYFGTSEMIIRGEEFKIKLIPLWFTISELIFLILASVLVILSFLFEYVL